MIESEFSKLRIWKDHQVFLLNCQCGYNHAIKWDDNQINHQHQHNQSESNFWVWYPADKSSDGSENWLRGSFFTFCYNGHANSPMYSCWYVMAACLSKAFFGDNSGSQWNKKSTYFCTRVHELKQFKAANSFLKAFIGFYWMGKFGRWVKTYKIIVVTKLSYFTFLKV